MSANNWRVCPRCKRQNDEERAKEQSEVHDQYGKVYAFRVWCKDRPEFEATINTRTAGRAKREYLDRLRDAGWRFAFVDLRVQKLGPCHTSEQFRSNARYRGVPNVECGQRVIVGSGRGVIVGHNASANFDVLFDDDSPRYAGMTLNVHPGDVQYA